MGVLGHMGHGDHKNNARRGHLGSHRTGFGHYGRGNFPGHHVFGSLTKSGVHGSRWVQMASDGCGWVHRQGRKQKQDKKSRTWVRRGCFVTYAHRAKKTGSE